MAWTLPTQVHRLASPSAARDQYRGGEKAQECVIWLALGDARPRGDVKDAHSMGLTSRFTMTYRMVYLWTVSLNDHQKIMEW